MAVVEPPAASPPSARNPGPSWGYQFLRLCDFLLPEGLFKPLRAAGTWVAVLCMPARRSYSVAYLRLVLPTKPGWRDVFRHFFAFEEALMARLRIANGRHIDCGYAPGSDDFRAWMENGEPALLGTMHIGVSDMLGFQLAGKSTQRVYLVRQKVANSHDTEALASRFGNQLEFLWVNDPRDIIFALKDAARTDGTIALQCDRADHSARCETFHFLGAARRFPFTIYHLSLIFERPVLLSVGVSTKSGQSRLFAVPRFARQVGESRDAALRRAREHFQSFLVLVESVLRDHPYDWFNFLPLNRVDDATSPPAP